jgi:Vault protein inter-alpha-trypsin domain/von Willebrand factor type A domain
MGRFIKLMTEDSKEIPLKDVLIHVDIYNHIGQFTISQKYISQEEKPLEVFYTFPTPANASVFEFTAKIGEKVIKTILKEKKKAQEEYNKAISQGHGAYLMERITGDIFSVSLGNMPPKSEILITIKYIIELKTEVDASQLRLSIPLTIMPKYITNINPTPAILTQGQLVNPKKVDTRPYNLSVEGYLAMPDGILSFDSKTCKMKLSQMKETSLHFQIQDLENINEDIILTIKRNQPKSICFTEKGTELLLDQEIYRHATMINVVPSFDKVPLVNPADVHYTIVIDKSGSMEGPDIENCKQGAKILLLALPIGSTFDVYKFDNYFEKFKPMENGDIKIQALEWIDKINANGGTEMFAVLDDAYNSIKQINKSGVLILLSDGAISDNESVMKLVKRNPGVSVFTIGIGQNVSHQLIEGLAEHGHGKAEFVNSGTDQIKDKIMAQLKRAQTSLRKFYKESEIKIDVDGPYNFVPTEIPTLYENDINTFFVLSQNPIRSIYYNQTSKEYPVNMNVPIHLIEDQNYPLHRMAGIKKIDHLEINNSLGSQISHQKQDPCEGEIIAASMNFGVLSKYTSFVGVEFREEKDKTTDRCILKEVPLQTPKKYIGGPRFECDNLEVAKCAMMMPKSFYGGALPKLMVTSPCSVKSTGPVLESFDSFEENMMNEEDTTDEEAIMANKAPKLTNKQTTITPTITIDKLPAYMKSGNLLSGSNVGTLPSADKIKVDDYVLITGEGVNNGMYKVWSVGSPTEHWILEKV